MPPYTLKDAEDAIRRKFADKEWAKEIKYDLSQVTENERWWHIPYGWIGCFGFIVNKSDLDVNWLGSASMSLDDCFWGHDHGVYCDLVDFTFDVNTDAKLAMRLLPLFKHTHSVRGGPPLSEPVWYRESELESEFARQFPAFRRHFVWPHIPNLRRAYENEGLRFSCCVSKGA